MIPMSIIDKTPMEIYVETRYAVKTEPALKGMSASATIKGSHNIATRLRYVLKK